APESASSAFRFLPSHRGQFEALAVVAAEQLVRLRVVPDRLGRGVEVERPAGPVGDVAEVAQPGAGVADLDVGVGGLAVADAVEEVADVGPDDVLAGRLLSP